MPKLTKEEEEFLNHFIIANNKLEIVNHLQEYAVNDKEYPFRIHLLAVCSIARNLLLNRDKK